MSEKKMKMEKEYEELYGNISKDPLARMDEFLNTLHRPYRGKIDDEIHRISNIRWKEEKFTIYLLPKATPRPRSTSQGSFFYVKGASDNKRFFRKAISNWDLPIITTPCEFRCVSYLPIPKSMKPLDQLLAELGFIRPISKPDFDNLAKTYADMIQEIFIYDDALIVTGISKKFYSWKPRIEISVRYMEEYDSDFNKNKIIKRKE